MSDTLEPNEFHPMAPAALKYVRQNITAMDIESMASCAIEGNRTAEICLGTWNRIDQGKPVSDRYVFGLAWFIKILRDHKQEEIQFSEIFDVKH